jgi:hypothetical protein
VFHQFDSDFHFVPVGLGYPADSVADLTVDFDFDSDPAGFHFGSADFDYSSHHYNHPDNLA